MLQIDALPAFNDNYLWLMQDPSSQCCAVVDPGDAAPVLAWLSAHPQWRLTDILITHHHGDHVGGVAQLKAATGARVVGPALENIPERDVALNDGDIVEVLGHSFNVLHVPGHTLGHLAYYHAPLLFCGDTLFAAGCGRLFEGTAQQMHHSLQRLAALPDTTKVYCTHEYTLSNLRFAQAVEPENPDIAQRLQQVSEWRERQQMSLPSNLALEKATNPFLRTEKHPVAKKMQHEEETQIPTPVEVFTRLRRWKDQF